jgi:hypothetical protein
MPNQVREFVREFCAKHKGLEPEERNKRIVEEVKRKFDVILSRHQIYRIVSQIDEIREKIAPLNENEPKQPWEVVDGKYILKTKHGTFGLSVEQVDLIFKDYSKFGANLSGEEILRKYKLKPEAWQALKNKLRLYKASHVISPHTAENLPEKEVDQKVEEAIGAHIDTIKEKMVLTHHRRFKAEALEAMRIVQNVDYFLGHLKSKMETWTPPTYKVNATPIKAPGELTVVLTDLHYKIGKYEEVNARTDEVAKECIDRKEGTVNVLLTGDLAETLCSEMMHDSQVNSMKGHDVFETMLQIADSIEKFLVKIAESGKTVHFRGIGGNHDRISRQHDQDIRRTGALVIYELISRALKLTDIKVEYYTEKINKFVSGNLAFVFHHGDDGFSKRKPEDILWKNGIAGKYNVIVHGDKHTLTMRETKDATMIGVPAMAGEGEYDKRLDLHSEPGAIFVNENSHGTADIQLKRLS